MHSQEFNDESFEVSGKEWHVLRRSTLRGKDILESIALTRLALRSATTFTDIFCPSVARKASHSVFELADQWSAWLLEKGVLTIHNYKKREETLLDTCSVLSANVARLRTNVAESTQDKDAVSIQVIQLKENVERLQQMTQAAERSREVAEAARSKAELQLVREQLGMAQARERIRDLEGALAAASAPTASSKQPRSVLEASRKSGSKSNSGSGNEIAGSVSGSSGGSAGSSASDRSCLDDSFDMGPLQQHDDEHRHTDNEEEEEDKVMDSLVDIEHHHHVPITAARAR